MSCYLPHASCRSMNATTPHSYWRCKLCYGILIILTPTYEANISYLTLLAGHWRKWIRCIPKYSTGYKRLWEGTILRSCTRRDHKFPLNIFPEMSQLLFIWEQSKLVEAQSQVNLICALNFFSTKSSHRIGNVNSWCNTSLMIALSKTTWFGKESNVNFNHVQLSSLSQKHGSNKYYKMLKVICYLDMIAFSNCNNFFKITTGLAWILTLLIIFNVVTSVSFEVKLTSLGRSW